MRTFKRAAAWTAAMALCLSAGVSAQANRVVDYAFYTDIVATIDDHPVRSYNIGGNTAVVAEELAGCGFEVIWNASSRTLRILRDETRATPQVWPTYTAPALTQRIGARAQPIYETDIVTYIADKAVRAFNINGETLVWMDDLAPFGTLVWRPDARVLALTLGDVLTDWSVRFDPLADGTTGAALSLSAVRRGGDVTAERAEYPGGNMLVTISPNEVRIIHYAALFDEEGFAQTSYAAAYAALRGLGLPNVTQTDDFANSARLRADAAAYFRVTRNGEAVSGDLWWSQGNNHVDLNFTFDRPLRLRDGDVIALTVGA